MTNPEAIKSSEVEEKIRIYSGTSLQNFLRCAVKVEEGSYLFDKKREPRHTLPNETFYVLDPHQAFGSAVFIVGTIQQYSRDGVIHTPAVISGEVRKEFQHQLVLPDGEMLSVDQVWLPNPNIDWKTVNPYQTPSPISSCSPSQVLEQLI